MRIRVYNGLSFKMRIRVVLMRWSRRRDISFCSTQRTKTIGKCVEKELNKEKKPKCVLVYKERTTQKNKCFFAFEFRSL